MSTKKIQTGLRMTDSMYRKLKTLADQDSRTMNNLVELILRRYIDDYERQHGEIHPADD